MRDLWITLPIITKVHIMSHSVKIIPQKTFELFKRNKTMQQFWSAWSFLEGKKTEL